MEQIPLQNRVSERLLATSVSVVDFHGGLLLEVLLQIFGSVYMGEGLEDLDVRSEA